jgi:hypothetical protein
MCCTIFLAHLNVSPGCRCTLLLGSYAPIDLSDGAGMNFMDLKTQVCTRRSQPLVFDLFSLLP